MTRGKEDARAAGSMGILLVVSRTGASGLRRRLRRSGQAGSATGDSTSNMPQ